MNDLSPITLTIGSVATVATPNASRYLQQLCKHFQHKLPVTFDPHSGQIVYSIGDCRLVAGEAVLTLLVMSQDAGRLEQLQDVVARHLLRFAFREDMKIDWHPL
jgi:uncharacterized protein